MCVCYNEGTGAMRNMKPDGYLDDIELKTEILRHIEKMCNYGKKRRNICI